MNLLKHQKIVSWKHSGEADNLLKLANFSCYTVLTEQQPSPKTVSTFDNCAWFAERNIQFLLVFFFNSKISIVINFKIYNFKDTSNCTAETSFATYMGTHMTYSMLDIIVFAHWHTSAVHFIFHLNFLAIILLKFKTHLVGWHPCISPSVILLMCGGFFKFTCGVVVFPALHYLRVPLGPRFLCLQKKNKKNPYFWAVTLSRNGETNSTCNDMEINIEAMNYCWLVRVGFIHLSCRSTAILNMSGDLTFMLMRSCQDDIMWHSNVKVPEALTRRHFYLFYF